MLRKHEQDELTMWDSWENAERGESFGETQVVDLDLNRSVIDSEEITSEGLPLLNDADHVVDVRRSFFF